MDHVSVLVPRPLNPVTVTPLRLLAFPLAMASEKTTRIPVICHGKRLRVVPIRL